MPRSRTRLIWLVGAVIPLIAGMIAGLLLTRKNPHKAPVAAYLLPTGDDNLVKSSWWPARKIVIPVTLHADELITIPNSSSVILLHAATGASETINGPARIILPQKLPSETEALTSPLDEVFKKHLDAPHADRSIVITSPVGVTRYLNPVIAWENGQPPYDVAVVDPADPDIPPRVATNISGPVALSDLETPQRRQLGFDRNYEVVVRTSNENQRLLGHARFLTLPDAALENQLPTTAAGLMAEACAAMAKKPYRTGDAWLALSKLPADWKKSELGVRLRMRVSEELLSPLQIEESRTDTAKILRLH